MYSNFSVLYQCFMILKSFPTVFNFPWPFYEKQTIRNISDMFFTVWINCLSNLYIDRRRGFY
ncbi:hypothetical protein BY996DRAFT_7278621 [Phakopsora pachyrhizi]|nr:hypothetical protein BY996DRAFT_7278621 [Phakopsora pachyrhizi]